MSLRWSEDGTGNTESFLTSTVPLITEGAGAVSWFGVQLDVESLRTSLAVLDQGSRTRAARTLHLTQSAVSWRIKRLEERVGRPLLDPQRRADAQVVGVGEPRERRDGGPRVESGPDQARGRQRAERARADELAEAHEWLRFVIQDLDVAVTVQAPPGV